MNANQSTLGDYAVTREHDPEESTTTNIDALQTTSGSNQCLSCGSVVSDAYVRVHADNNGDLHNCLHCVGRQSMLNGAGSTPNGGAE